MKPADGMLPGEWLTLLKVYTHVTKLYGGDTSLALNDIKQALADGKIAAVVRPLTNHKYRVLPVGFWQTHQLRSVAPDHIIVRSNEYPPIDYRYFLRQSDVEKIWPGSNQPVIAAADEIPWRRKSTAGAKGDYDWEKIIIEAARHMWENGVPESEAKLRSHIEDWCKGDAPGESQLKSHLAPLYRVLKKADGK